MARLHATSAVQVLADIRWQKLSSLLTRSIVIKRPHSITSLAMRFEKSWMERTVIEDDIRRGLL